ncbi:hypothetical protein I4F81_005975 [Pyropia yezoensis]|uniref:Uncharacterized protein n=1 Tax=Pyropia yezoensis TaxID=2788 RepID=A0ACC3BZD0_PYRYE|nr:hypothetical protein I4F81_005975 [Neopyropia yezoensis]
MTAQLGGQTRTSSDLLCTSHLAGSQLSCTPTKDRTAPNGEPFSTSPPSLSQDRASSLPPRLLPPYTLSSILPSSARSTPPPPSPNKMKAVTVLSAALIAVAATIAPAVAQLPGGIPFPSEGPSGTRRPLPWARLTVAPDGSVVANWQGVKSCTIIEAGGLPTDGWTLPRETQVVVRDGADWAELDHEVLHWACMLK